MSVGAELGRLAQLAAQATERNGTETLETRIAAVLGELRDHPAPARLVAAAADTTRPLARRVAVLAALHRALVVR